jgi:hypothetical protein
MYVLNSKITYEYLCNSQVVKILLKILIIYLNFVLEDSEVKKRVLSRDSRDSTLGAKGALNSSYPVLHLPCW